MARVTVEDCVVKVPNRFELVLLASQRARDLLGGTPPTVEKENDKNPVIALREIAENTVTAETLRNALIGSLQRHVDVDEPDDESMTILAAAEKEWADVTGGEPTAEPASAEEAPSALDVGDVILGMPEDVAEAMTVIDEGENPTEETP